MIKQYKQDFLKYWEEEKYKWQSLKWFQDNWNVDAVDFGEMFERATSKTDNLLASNQNYPKGVIIALSSEYPTETKQLFVDLYDENVDLESRVNTFKSKSNELVNKHNKQHPDDIWNNSYQQENAITTYLWLRYPEKYYIYKFTEYKAVVERLGCPDIIKAGNGYQNIKNGFEIYDKIAAALSKDYEIKNMLANVLTEDCYPDKSLRTLTVDVGHYVKSYTKVINYWAVGFSWESAGDMRQKFFEDGVWIEGFLKGGDKRYEKSVKAISAGDYLILKSSATKGAGHKVSFTRLIRIGRVVERLNDYSLKVDWLDYPELPRDFDGASYRKTIEKMRNDSMLDYVKHLVKGNEYDVESKYQDYITLLEANHNLILSGAPGTGKTYMAKAIAEEMGAECEFVQFHPSYDYTDFVEGLRPTQDFKGQIGFERKDGVFKAFLKRAAKNLEDSKKSKKELSEERTLEDRYNEVINKIENDEITEFKLKTGGKKMEVVKISDFNNIVLKTPETTSDRTYTVSFARIAKLAKVFPDAQSLNAISNINDAIRNAIGGCNASSYWAVLSEVYKQPEIIYSTINLGEEKSYVFIIDEINRGEISKIFGELFFSIDPGYRGVKGLVKTQYQNLIEEGDAFKDGFYVPENVYIIGTMNDIDRSVESMDFAMRRRFAWKEVTAEDSMQMLNGLKNEAEIKRRMTSLNNAILKINGLGKAYQIGAAYFKKIEDYGGDFQKLWDYHLQGLLYEYLRGNINANEQLEELKKAYDEVADPNS